MTPDVAAVLNRLRAAIATCPHIYAGAPGDHALVARRVDLLEAVADAAESFVEGIEEDHPAIDQARLHRLHMMLDALEVSRAGQ